ncbi:hypothetical protein ABT034_14990 [Streptomyces sp. NPDC002773]|uniref:hypothetical protein n=1 Tax=Streptomyces sp. NPDC002773 TaxID=3154430 RepID=UPI00331BFC2E
MSDIPPIAVAVVSQRVSERLKELGHVAAAAVEDLRRELEQGPRVGIRRDGPQNRHGGVAYKTWLEPRPGMPGLAVAYVYVATPLPPVMVIISVVPDDSPEPA